MKNNISIEMVDASILIPAEYNPRQMTEKQEADLEASLKQFGMVDPIIVNSNKDRYMIVIGGHMRLKIAIKLGYKKVPVVFLSLNKKQEKENPRKLSSQYDYLIKTGMDESVALEIDEYEQEKGKRKKRLANKERKDDNKWK